MTNQVELARRVLLEPGGISNSDLEKTISQVMGPGVDNADLYFQGVRSESWILEDGIIKDGDYSLEHGVGVRAISGDRTGFAYSDDIILPALEQAASAARSIASRGQNQQLQVASQGVMVPHELYATSDPLVAIPEEDKVALLHAIDKEARGLDPRIKHVTVSLGGTYETVFIINNEGKFAADVRPLVHLRVSVVAESNGRREQGTCGGGGRLDYKMFLQDELGLEYARSAVQQALTNLDAVAAPAGNMPVVLGSGWPGVLLHEAVGHGLEGDHIRKQSSAFAGRVGERVASPQCTIVDDGTIQGRRGSLNVDDEGNPTQCTTLIENGILKGFMQDSLNARLMGEKPTGNGRRESYAHTPMPRMTNTYMLAGKYDPAEIISSVEKGLYAVNFSGGQVDTTSGNFVFSASEAYLIENGKVTKPVKGATIIGSGPDILTRVSMVGNDLQLDQGIGTCGKEGQSVPVGVGQPTLKVDEITVGGTANE